MIQHKIGDLFASNADIIAHQVNCQGVMGSGVAKQVRMLFPGAYANYQSACRSVKGKTESLLGNTQLSSENLPDGKRIYIANMFAQNKYGYDGKQYTDYGAFRSCLAQLSIFADAIRQKSGKEPQIALPYRIGCDRGGGNWDTVYTIIEEELGGLDVTLYELPKS